MPCSHGVRGSSEGSSEAANAHVAQVSPTPDSTRSSTRSGRPSAGTRGLCRTRSAAVSTSATVTTLLGWTGGWRSKRRRGGLAATAGSAKPGRYGVRVVMGSGARVRAMGAELRKVHDGIRDLLEDARDGVRRGGSRVLGRRPAGRPREGVGGGAGCRWRAG